MTDIKLPVTQPTEKDLRDAVQIQPYAAYVTGKQVLIGSMDGELDTLAQALGLDITVVEEYTDGYQLYQELTFPYVYPGAVGMGHGVFTKIQNADELVGYSGYLCGYNGVGQ